MRIRLVLRGLNLADLLRGNSRQSGCDFAEYYGPTSDRAKILETRKGHLMRADSVGLVRFWPCPKRVLLMNERARPIAGRALYLCPT
jgi:hypothetical protein